MAAFKDWSEVYEPLVLSVGGKAYTLPEVSGSDRLRYEAATRGDEGVEPLTDEQFRDMLLGPIYRQMVDDGASVEAIRRAELTGLANMQNGREMAALMWATGGEPAAMETYLKAHTPNGEATRTKTKSKG